MRELDVFLESVRNELEVDPVHASSMVIAQIEHRRRAIRAVEALTAGQPLLAGQQRELDAVRAELDQLEQLRVAVDANAREVVEAERAEHRQRVRNSVLADHSDNPHEVRVTSEPRIYDGRSGGPSIFADMWNAQRNSDVEALGRLQQHQAEARAEQRDVGTGSFGGLVPPSYLISEFAPVLRNSRALANAVRHVPLPEHGMSVIIPRGETGVSVAPQATQNVAVSETDPDYDNDLTIPVQTFAGQVDVSRQTLERGTGEIDRILFADLVAAYGARLDSSIINDDGTGGTHVGLQNITGENVITYTDATPTLAEFWPKLADAIQQIASKRKQPANLIVMSARRWGWLLASVDSQSRPLLLGEAGNAAAAIGRDAGNFGEGQLVGTLMGLPVLVDNNVPLTAGVGTDEDVVFVVRREDLLLFEDSAGMPRQLRFEDAGAATLTVKLLAYGYSAWTAERYPSAVSRITGTGLIAPTF